MNKKNLLWVLLVLLLIGLVGFGLWWMNRMDHIEQGGYVAQTASSASVTPQVTAPVTLPVAPTTTAPVEAGTSTRAEGFVEINQFFVMWNGKPYQFTHRCLGDVKMGTFKGSSKRYCVGDNQLSVRGEDGEETIILSGISQDAANAPMLFGADLINVPSDANGTVLITYMPDPCATPGSVCGVGGPYNLENFAYSLRDGSLKPLKHYPGTGAPTWNAGIGGMKAIFIPDTCGGDGCVAAPLTGYNLDTDTASPLTSLGLAAGYTDGSTVQSANGTLLPVWQPLVHWKSDVDFTVQVRQPDGTLKTVAGKF